MAQFDWSNKLFYCSMGASAISSIAVLAGLGTFIGVNVLGAKAAGLLILSGGGGAGLSFKYLHQAKSRPKTFEKYVQSLSPEYVKQHFTTLFPHERGNNGFSFLNQEQISAILPLLNDPYNLLLTDNQVRLLTPQQVNALLDKIPFDKLHNLNETHIKGLNPRDLSLYNAHRLFNFDKNEGKERFSWLDAHQILIFISNTMLDERFQVELTKTQVQSLDVNSLTKAQRDWLFPKTEKGKTAFSWLSGTQVTTLLKKELLNERVDFITETQIKNLDVTQLEKPHLDLLFPLDLMVFSYSKARFSHLKVSQITILQKRNLLSSRLDMISRPQLKALDVDFFKKLTKNEVAILFPLDPFSLQATQLTFKGLNISQVHALLPNLSDQAPSLIFTDSHMQDLDPTKLTSLQIINLYNGPKKDFAYGLLKEEYRKPGSRFSLRLSSLGLGNLVKK